MRRNTNIPPVHKKVKKKDMLFEYVLISIIVLSFLFFIVYSLDLVPFLNKYVDLPSIAGAIVALYALVWQVHSAIKEKKVLAELSLNSKVEDKLVTLSCSLTNVGTKSIYPYLTNLYISEAIEVIPEPGVTKYVFERITEHRIDRETGECFDCQLAQHCKNDTVNDLGKISFPPCEDERFKNTTRYCCNLRQLSYYSLVHIEPKETFKEEIVLKIDKPGVYRAFVIYTGKEWDDCICTTHVFKID